MSDLPDLQAFAQALEGPLLLRWMKNAQRQALLDFRDRTEYPGLAARFQPGNPYLFNYRIPGNRRKLPPYRHTGAMMQELLRRTPKSRTVGGEVVTTMSIRPRVLPFLARYKSIFSIVRGVAPVTYTAKVYKDSVGRTGAYQMQITRMSKTKRLIFTDKTYADEWALRPEETTWIADAVDAKLSAVLRQRIRRQSRGRVRLPASEGDAA